MPLTGENFREGRKELAWLNSGVEETSKSKEHYDPSQMRKIRRMINTGKSKIILRLFRWFTGINF